MAPIKAGGKRSKAMIALTIIGVIMGLGGATHGPGEILQSGSTPGSFALMAWPELTALAGEPAMTLIPNYLITGVLAIVFGVAVAVWSALYLNRRHGGLVLVQLSLLMLLFGGGIVPPIITMEVGLLATLFKDREERVRRIDG